jgi:two-component system phosphate regulon sensor histidine kinase PhoR
MPDAIVVVNKNFETEWFNKAAVKILSLKEIDIGKPIAHMIRNPSFAEFIKKNKVGSSINFISPLKYDLTIKCFMVPYGEDRNLLTFRDVSESDQLDKMRRDFIANVSHELKTPLTVIFGYLETLSFSDDGYVDDDIISEMLKQSKRMDFL